MNYDIRACGYSMPRAWEDVKPEYPTLRGLTGSAGYSPVMVL